MSKTKRNVGREILDGLREIKRGEYGRVSNMPDVAMINPAAVGPRAVIGFFELVAAYLPFA
jgi:hypothetical protein